MSVIVIIMLGSSAKNLITLKNLLDKGRVVSEMSISVR